jgi:membrane-associated phospholipid phosphatase
LLRLYRDNRIFYILTLLFIITGALILALTDKGEVEIFVNRHSQPVADQVFYYLTFLGDGILICLIILYMFVRKIWYGVLGTVIFAISSLITQVFKRTVFADFPRPSRYFDASHGLRYMEDLEIHQWNSFPSGHSSGAFTIFLLISLISKKPWIQTACFLLALAAAFSRVYLLQHFYMDIYGGAIAGVVITSFLYYQFQYKSRLGEHPSLDRPLSDLFL